MMPVMTTKAAITIHTMTTGVKSFPFLELFGSFESVTGCGIGTLASKLALHISLVQQQKKCPCSGEASVSRHVSLAEHESDEAREIKRNIM